MDEWWDVRLASNGNHFYFDDKEKAFAEREKEKEQNMKSIVNYGNIVYGNVSGSTLSVDNSTKLRRQSKKMVETIKKITEEMWRKLRELLENIQVSRTTPKQKSF